MKLNCVIIDDEPLAIELLRSYVEKTPFLELAGAFENPLDSVDIITEMKVDLVFLDINMPQISGLDFSKTLPESTKLIFTTAYDQYAVEGFRLNATDYLLKPINYEEFLRASTKALEWFRIKNIKVEDSDWGNIFVKSGYRMEKINLKSILYIENQRDYVKFHIEGKPETINSLISMQSLEKRLPEDKFMRVHRSFIVNLDKIQTIERNCIVFGKEYIPVSISYKDKFNEFMDKHVF